MRRKLGLVLVLLLTGALYAPWISHAFIWDDFVQISENPAVRDGVPFARYFTDRATTSSRPDYNTRIYRPLRNVAFRALWVVSNAAPERRTTFFLGANLLLYLLGGLLVFALCRRLSDDPGAALVGVSAWLLLPVHAEDVLYASALGDLLSFDLQLLGVICVVDAIDAERGGWRGLVALFTFGLAVFVKEAAITSMLIVPAYVLSERSDAIRRGAARRLRVVGLVVGHVIVGLSYLTLRTAILGRIGQEDVHAEKTARAALHAPWLLLSYLKSALAPLGHAPDYDYRFPTLPIAVLALVVGAGLFLWCNLKPTRGVRFGAWIYVLALAPVLHFVPLWTLMADRFLLVPTVGLALIIAALVARATPKVRFGLIGVVVTGCVLWTGGTVLEARHFADDETLFAYGVQEVPRSQLSNHNYGLTLLKQGNLPGAIQHLSRAIELGRTEPRLYYHLAGALESAGRYDEARLAVAEAIKRKPDQTGVYVLRARLERRAGRLDEAEQSLTKARETNDVPAMIDREAATLATVRGRFDEALAIFRRLAADAPGDPRLWLHVAECELKLEHAAEARVAVDRCLTIVPIENRCVLLKQHLETLPAPAPATRALP